MLETRRVPLPTLRATRKSFSTRRISWSLIQPTSIPCAIVATDFGENPSGLRPSHGLTVSYSGPEVRFGNEALLNVVLANVYICEGFGHDAPLEPAMVPLPELSTCVSSSRFSNRLRILWRPAFGVRRSLSMPILFSFQVHDGDAIGLKAHNGLRETACSANSLCFFVVCVGASNWLETTRPELTAIAARSGARARDYYAGQRATTTPPPGRRGPPRRERTPSSHIGTRSPG